MVPDVSSGSNVAVFAKVMVPAASWIWATTLVPPVECAAPTYRSLLTTSTSGGSTIPPVAVPSPTVIGEPVSGVPAELNPYSLPSAQPTKTFPKPSTTGPVTSPVHVPPIVTTPAVPQAGSRLMPTGAAMQAG